MIARSDSAVTVVPVLSELFFGFGSGGPFDPAVAPARLGRSPATSARTTRRTVALSPTPRVPRLHVTVCDPPQLPWLGDVEIRVAIDGTRSVTVTLGALAGPSLVTVRV